MSHVVLFADFWHYFFGITLTLTAIFLILLVLVQRGRGGGLAGAFGGMGGQSAFGTKAGDMFTRVTIGVSLFWILMCVAAVKFLGSAATGSFGRAEPPAQTRVAPPPGGLDEPIPSLPDSGATGPPGGTPTPSSPTTEVPGTAGDSGESPAGSD